MTNEKSTSPLRQRMLDDMKMRKLSAKTQDRFHQVQLKNNRRSSPCNSLAAIGQGFLLYRNLY